MPQPVTTLKGSSAPSFEALLDRPDMVWMGQNTTHVEPSGEVLDAISESLARREFQLYAPAAGFARLRALIVEDLGIPDLDCWVTDGAVGGLHQVVTTLAPSLSRVITGDPGWPWPARFAGVSGVPVDVVRVYETARRLLTADLIEPVIEKGALLYLIDPLNPLGSSYTRGELAEIVELARAHEAFVVHDATYRHFADEHTLAVALYPERTITTYSLSKWLGLAGFRVGAIVAAPELLSRLTSVPGNPLGAGIVSQRAAIAGLEVRHAWLSKVRGVNRRNLESIEELMARTPGARVVVPGSQGNFLAVDVSESPWSAEGLCEAILDEDVFIRPGTYQSPAFGNRFVKISTAVPEAWADRFRAVWTSVFARVDEAR